MRKNENFIFLTKNWHRVTVCIMLAINGALFAAQEKRAVQPKMQGRFFGIPMQDWVVESQGKDSLTDARKNNTIFDYFMKHEDAPYPAESKLGSTGEGNLSQYNDKLVFTPENFLFINFFAHFGIRGELMAHFVSPNEYTFGNTWDEWKRWGRYFDFVRFHTEEMKMLMAKAIFNLIRDDKPDQILQLRDRIVNEIPGQAQELLDRDYSDTRKQRADEIGAREENTGSWDPANRVHNPNAGDLRKDERQFLEDTVKFLEEWAKRRDEIIKKSQDILIAGLQNRDAFALEKGGEKTLTTLELLLEKGWDTSDDQKKGEVLQLFLSTGGLAAQNIIAAKKEKQREMEREESKEKGELPEQVMAKSVQDAIAETMGQMAQQFSAALAAFAEQISGVLQAVAQQIVDLRRDLEPLIERMRKSGLSTSQATQTER